MKCFVVLLLLSIALSAYGTFTPSSVDHGYGYGYGVGVSGAVYFPSYSTSKPIYVKTVKPTYGIRPYTGHGSAYAYGYKPAYSKPTYAYGYRPYYAYPYYGYGSNSVYGYNPYYYGSYKHGIYNQGIYNQGIYNQGIYNHGYDYTDYAQ